jgi:predicted porin
LENLEMKKTLVAIAALTAVSAFAQSSVTIYGKEDISYGKIKTDHYTATKDVKSTALADSQVESSRIGFKGVEDLGSGMNAGFILESGLNLAGGTTFAKAASGANVTSDGATNSSSIFGAATRQALVSVGSTTLGNLSVGYKKQAELDAVETNTQNTVNSAGGSAIKDNRLDRANGLYYVSPTMSGIYATVQYTAGKTAYDDATTALAKNAEVKLTSLTLNYAQGPLTAVAHTGSGKITLGSIAASTTQLVDGTLSSGANASVFSVSGQNKYDTTVIGAAYDFGVAKVNALSGTRKVGVESAATFQDVK